MRNTGQVIMNYAKFTLLAAVLVILVIDVRGDATPTERQAKYLRYNGISDLGKLNIDRILSQWNKSSTEDTTKPSLFVAPEESEMDEEGDKTSDVYSVISKLSSAFKKCIFAHKKKILQDTSEGKRIIFKCFRVELINELHGIITETESISLLNGYVELEKIDRPKKKHDKVTKKAQTAPKPKDQSSDAQYYSNIFHELFVEKESGRGFTDNSTTEFSGYGKELIKEISENLEDEEEQMRSLQYSVMDEDFLSVLGEMSRKFALRLNLFPGVAARMRRSQSTGVTFDLELDDITGFGDDDEDDEKKKKKRRKSGLKGNKDDSSEEDSDEEEDDEEEDDDDDDDDELRDENEVEDEEDNGEEEGETKGNKRGKGKGGKNKMKKKAKMLKKLIPYLLIPMMIQAVMLPIAFKFLLMFAIKALLAGKVALLLVAINLIKNTNFKSDEDEYIERVGQEHYGYGKGEEYGAWINRRAYHDADDAPTDDNHPYRAYTPTEKAK